MQMNGLIEEYVLMLQLVLDLHFQSSIVATIALPLPDQDTYLLDVQPGQSYQVSLDDIFDDAGSSMISLAASFVILAADEIRSWQLATAMVRRGSWPALPEPIAWSQPPTPARVTTCS